MHYAEGAASLQRNVRERVATGLHRILTSQSPGFKITERAYEAANRVATVCTSIRSAAASLTLLTQRRWNSARPIHQLPDEILSLIFHTVLESFLDDPQRRLGQSSYLTIQQTLRSVCSLWNHIISSSRVFWTTLTCTDVGSKRFEIALSKAGETGLRAICRRSRYCSKFVTKVVALSERWSSIDVIAEPWIGQLGQSHVFPNLQHLRVFNKHRDLVPAIRFQEIFPSLTRLQLDGIMPHKNSTPIPNLRFLALCANGSLVRTIDLLHILSRHDLLEELDLSGMMLFVPSRSPGQCPSVAAPTMRRMRIERVGDYTDLALFLSNIELPPSASSEVFLEREYDNPIILTDYVSRRATVVEGKPSLHVDLRQLTRPRIELRGPDSRALLRLRLKRRGWAAAWQNLRSLLRCFGPVMERNGMLELYLPPDNLRGRDAIRMATTYFPSLTILELWGPGALDLLGKRESGGSLAFPCLSALRIHGTVDCDSLIWILAVRRGDLQVNAIQSLTLDNLPEPTQITRIKRAFPSIKVLD